MQELAARLLRLDEHPVELVLSELRYWVRKRHRLICGDACVDLPGGNLELRSDRPPSASEIRAGAMAAYHGKNDLSDLLRIIDPDFLPDVREPKREIRSGQLLDEPNRCAIDRLVDQTEVAFLTGASKYNCLRRAGDPYLLKEGVLLPHDRSEVVDLCRILL